MVCFLIIHDFYSNIVMHWIRKRPVYQTQHRMTFAHAISDIQLKFLASASLTFLYLLKQNKSDVHWHVAEESGQASWCQLGGLTVHELHFKKNTKKKACRVKMQNFLVFIVTKDCHFWFFGLCLSLQRACFILISCHHFRLNRIMLSIYLKHVKQELFVVSWILERQKHAYRFYWNILTVIKYIDGSTQKCKFVENVLALRPM